MKVWIVICHIWLFVSVQLFERLEHWLLAEACQSESASISLWNGSHAERQILLDSDLFNIIFTTTVLGRGGGCWTALATTDKHQQGTELLKDCRQCRPQRFISMTYTAIRITCQNFMPSATGHDW